MRFSRAMDITNLMDILMARTILMGIHTVIHRITAILHTATHINKKTRQSLIGMPGFLN